MPRPVGLACLLIVVLANAGCHDLSLDLLSPDATSASSESGPTPAPIVHCSASSQCGDAAAQFCDVEAGACVECLSNDDCSGSTPHCLGGACVSCTKDADCSTGMVCNMHIPRCATQCTSGAQCNGNPCATAYGYCVECLSDVDCTSSSLPFCFEPPAYGLCVGCRSSADCHGATCGPSMRCATP